ncbi:MAG: glycosyltransferase [Proteobacteria bacterium]|nr:glycosyltransferase [Pseudomonadota bacterium]
MIFALTLPALGALGMTAFNLAFWPRGRPGVAAEETVSILIPARNEQESIEACVRAALAALPAEGEVIVGDDASTDDTGEILSRIAAEDRRLRVICPPPLPAGWVGKPHNCHHLARAARGDRLVFVDADVTLQPDAISRLFDLAQRYEAGVSTVFPKQVTGTRTEAHLMPLLALTYTAWLPLPLVWASGDPRFLAANGQVLSMRSETYHRIGGFESVKAEVVDDMAFCRRAKELGERVVFADGQDLAHCRMYGSGAELWQGFTKNLYEGLGERPERLFMAIALYAIAFVLPYVLLAVGLLTGGGPLLVAGAVGVGANLLTRTLLAMWGGHHPSTILSHPFAVLGLMALAVDSARRTRSIGVSWAGRTYPRRADREAA